MRDEVVRYLEEYAEQSAMPVRLGVRVTSVEEALELLSDGRFDAVKIRLGRATPREDGWMPTWAAGIMWRGRPSRWGIFPWERLCTVGTPWKSRGPCCLTWNPGTGDCAPASHSAPT